MTAMSSDHAAFGGCFEVAPWVDWDDVRHFATRELADADAHWGVGRRGDEVHQLDEACTTLGCGCGDRYVGGEAGYGVGHYPDRAAAMAVALAEGTAVETVIDADTGDPFDRLVFSRDDDQTRRDIADGYHAGCSGTDHITGDDTAAETSTASTSAVVDRAALAVARCNDAMTAAYLDPRADHAHRDDDIVRADHDVARYGDDTMEAF
jgi:hypothetical protein